MSHFYGVMDISDSLDVKALSCRVDEVVDKMESLQDKIELIVQEMEKNKNQLKKKEVFPNWNTRSSWKKR